MAKGIFALEDLEDTDLAVEPVNEVEYIQAQNDLDDAHDELEELHETYQSADQDANTIEAVAESIPDTDDSPVESTIIATEALIRKLGLPNYSLESYKNSTNKALRASLEETVSNTQEAKKSLLKKIWEKIVAFFKKAYEFITGLFKKKIKDVKKKVDDLHINSAEEGIKKAEQNESVLDHFYNLHHIEKKGGKLIYKGHPYLATALYINTDEVVTMPNIEHNLNNLEEVFREVSSGLEKIFHLDANSDEFENIIKKFKETYDELDKKHISAADKDEVEIEIPTKNELQGLLDKVDNFSKKIAETEKKALVFVEKSNPANTKDPQEQFMFSSINDVKFILNTLTYFVKGIIRYVEDVTYILEKIEEYSK